MINSSQNELFYLYLTIFSIVFQRFFSKSVKKEAVLSSSTASGHETFFCASSFLRLCASAFVRFCFLCASAFLLISGCAFTLMAHTKGALPKEWSMLLSEVTYFPASILQGNRC